MKRSIVVCALVTLVFTVAATAQMVQMKKGEELKKLEFLVGEWISEDEMFFDPNAGPMKVEGSNTFTWEVGDVWLKQHYTASMGPMGTLHGTAHITWDAEKKMYINYWIDNYATVSLKSTGSFDDKGNLVFTGDSEYQGMKLKNRYTWSKNDDNTVSFLMEHSMDGGNNWMTSMTSKMKRK